MIAWRLHHRETTVSTNLDARSGAPWDVFTADYQTAGRGRLDHRWLSPPKTNLMMSVVLPVAGIAPEAVATLPLVVGWAVAQAIAHFAGLREGLSPSLREGLSPSLKWPNDVLLGGKKVCGILCERHGDNVIAGIGVNVREQRFSPEIAAQATFLGDIAVDAVRDAVLERLAGGFERWENGGFSVFCADIAKIDFLKGRTISVLQTDGDEAPISGVCGGIRADGALDVGGVAVYAGEAHVEKIS